MEISGRLCSEYFTLITDQISQIEFYCSCLGKHHRNGNLWSSLWTFTLFVFLRNKIWVTASSKVEVLVVK